MSITSAKTLMTDSGGNSAAASAYKVSGKTPNELAHDDAVKTINKVLGDEARGAAATKYQTAKAQGEPLTPAAKAVENILSINPVGGIAPGAKEAWSTVKDWLSSAGVTIGDFANYVGDKVGDLVNPSGSSSGKKGSGGGYGGGSAASSSDSVSSYDDIMNLIRQTTAENNEWSAKQAQINRDWEKMMSDTAHQREVADLQAAGLNPVLSAGGSGASTGSPVMPDTDTSNTRVLAEVAMAALENATQSAGALGRIASKKEDGSLLSRVLSSPTVKFIGRSAASAAVRRLVYKIL